MRHYEIVALIDPNQNDNVDELVAKYRRIVEDSGGVVHRFENWGRRRLAYPIQNLYKAIYILLNIECEPAVKDQLENSFRYNDSIIRNLIIRVDKAITSQSPVMKKKIKREEEEREAEAQAAAELELARQKEAAKIAEEEEKKQQLESSAGDADSNQSSTAEAASAGKGNHSQ